MDRQFANYMAHLALTLLLGIATPALAEPPKGHPTPTQARDMLLSKKSHTAAELINEGTVLEVIHANEFTYMEVNRIDGRKWVAAQKMEIPLGTHIRYEDGAVMQNFYSKLLKRTFPSVMFVDHVVVTTQP